MRDSKRAVSSMEGLPRLSRIIYRARDRSASRLPLITTFTMKSVKPLAFGDILPSGNPCRRGRKDGFFPKRNWLRLKLSIPEDAITDNPVVGSAKGQIGSSRVPNGG